MSFAQVPSTLGDTATTLPVTHPKVLIVEDDDDTRLGLQVLLQANDYDVCGASCGESAVELALAEDPDVILLDLGLPGIDGFEVLERLRLRGHPRARIIVLSAWNPAMSEVRAIEAGATMYVQKPYSGQDLIDAIQFVLSLGAAEF